MKKQLQLQMNEVEICLVLYRKHKYKLILH